VLLATTPAPLRHIEGSPAAVVLCAGVAAGAAALATPRIADGASPHRVGQGVLVGLAGIGLATAIAAWALHDVLAARLALRWLAFPLALVTLGLGFAYVGRVHRLSGRRRLANLADLAGLTTALLWAGSQFLGGYPGPELWVPGLGAHLVGAAALAGLAAPLRSPR
jgi:hypothetical protein